MKLPKVPLLFVVGAGLVAFAFSLLPAAKVSQEARTNFKWFDGLGFPDVKGCPFVRAATGMGGRMGDESPQNQYLNAFLLERSATNFTTISLDLSQRTMTYSTNGAPEYQRVGYKRLNLKREANKLLDAYANGEIETDTTPGLDERISKRVSMFIFAWGCWRNGLNSQAEKLYQLSKTLRYGIAEIDEEHFQVVLEQEIAYAMMWRAVIDFGNTSISRPQLLREFQTIVTNYPHSDQQERARQIVSMLQRMIAEDEAHARNAPTNLDALPVDQRVDELIFRLRNQNGHQWGQPGSCDIFEDWRGVTNTTAHQLVKIGYPAVPQLIAALEDKTPTRSVGYWRDFTFSHYVLTVGDCVEAVLRRITGVAFYHSSCTGCCMSNEHKETETRKAAETWWADFQKNGEKQMLMTGAEAGNYDSIAQAQKLIERYPDAAVPALIKGARASTNWIRTSLVKLFEKFSTPQADAFLWQELSEGADSSRAAAAHILLKTDRAKTIKTVIDEWESDFNLEPDFGWRPPEIACFLAGADSPEAIEALGTNLEKRSVRTRVAVVTTVGQGGSHFGEIISITNRSPATCDAAEKLLVVSLQDVQQNVGVSVWHDNKGYSDLRVCDTAGYFLNQLWPKRYEFDEFAPLETRERQRIACQNVWKANHNK